MKKFILSLSLFTISLLGFSQFEKVELQASGLTCSMCSNAIHKALKTLPFVESIETDLNQNLFVIRLKKQVPVDFDAITKKVEGAGFSIAKCWLVADLHDLSIYNDEHTVMSGLNIHFMNVKPQTLNGSYRLQLIDQHFVQPKEYKRFSTLTAMSCYKTGTMAACCKSDHASASSRIYHVTI